MDWAKTYYTRQSETFARAVVTSSHHAIAQRLNTWCQALPRCQNVLELGAGMGGTAAALADLGHHVCAVEYNAPDAALAREVADADRAGEMRVVEQDFYTVEFETRFDFIYYWDGFGIGSDDDQRRLLTRIGREWLEPDGCAIIDVFSPWNWLRRAGETSIHTARDGGVWRRRVEFDVVGNRLVDSWHGPNDDEPPRSQTIRCYTIPDFALLLEGTGTRLDQAYEMDGSPIERTGVSADVGERLLQTNGYFARIVRS